MKRLKIFFSLIAAFCALFFSFQVTANSEETQPTIVNIDMGGSQNDPVATATSVSEIPADNLPAPDPTTSIPNAVSTTAADSASPTLNSKNTIEITLETKSILVENKNAVFLSWSGMDFPEYKIYRINNDKTILLATVTDKQFTDLNVSLEQKYTYFIGEANGDAQIKLSNDSEITTSSKSSNSITDSNSPVLVTTGLPDKTPIVNFFHKYLYYIVAALMLVLVVLIYVLIKIRRQKTIADLL